MKFGDLRQSSEKEKGGEGKTERARWRKCSSEGEIRGEDRGAGEEISKVEKGRNGGEW